MFISYLYADTCRANEQRFTYLLHIFATGIFYAWS